MREQSTVSKAIKIWKKNPTVRVILIIALLFAATYGSVELLRLGLRTESPLMVVSSGSMIPTLNVGDIILVRGANPRGITIGTIIIFHSPSQYDMPIVHRVIAIDNLGNTVFFETKGDNNPGPDGWRVPEQNLMGIYVMKIPYVGLLSLELRGPLGIILILLLVAMIIWIEYSESKSSSKKASK